PGPWAQNPRRESRNQESLMKTYTKSVAAVLVAALPLRASAAAPAGAAEGKVNITSASVEQLQLLPRIGPSVAQRIVEHRKANGQVKNAEKLMLGLRMR